MRKAVKQVLTLAFNISRENLRNRAFIILFFSGFMLFFLAQILGTAAVGDRNRVIQDMGFWVIGIWGLISSIFLGSNVITREISKKTIYMILSRPVNRIVFILGKFFGIIMVMFVLFGMFSGIFIIQLLIIGKVFTINFFIALFCVFLEWIVLAAFSIFFAVFTSPLLNGFILTAIFFFGHWSKHLYIYSENVTQIILKNFLILIYHILPNLELLNYRGADLYNETIELIMILKSILLSGLWSMTALLGGILIFSLRRLL